MAATLVQSRTSTGAFSLAFTSNVTAGNSVIVGIRCPQSTTITVTSVTDNLSNTYSLALGPARGGPNDQNIWQYVADNVSGGACTVTIAFSATPSGTHGLELHEVSGLDPAGSFDDSSSASGSGTAPNAGTVTPTVADGFAFAMCANNGGENSAGSGWTGYDPGNTYWYDYSETRIVTSTSSFDGDFSGPTGSYLAAVGVYKAASGGGPAGSPWYYYAQQ